MVKAINHVGVSVANLERSLRFYRDLLGLEVVVQMTFGGPRYEAILKLEGARGRVALLRAGQVQLELFEFEWPAPRLSDPDRPVCDHGITHFCIEVDNIELEYGRLTAAGAIFHCPPLRFGGSEIQATYVRDPDGNVIEFLERATSS